MRTNQIRSTEYVIALASLGAALALRYSLGLVLGDRLSFHVVIGAVAVSVAVGGLYPALLVTVLGWLAEWWLFLAPAGTPVPALRIEMLLAEYLFTAGTVILLGVLMRRAMRQSRAFAAELAHRSQQKDELLATVAHELRAPLAPIRTAVELMRRHGETGADLQGLRAIIERQTVHLARLIDDLVDNERAGRRTLDLRFARVSLQEVIAAGIESVDPILHARRQPLEVRIPPEPIVLTADTDRLGQVFVNLLTNASKFSPPGGRIALTASVVEDCAEVRVADAGEGIAPDALPHVFDLFYRGHRGSGLGIGLALVRQLVTLHDGTVTAYSEGPGRGTEFVVRLPLTPRKAAELGARTSIEPRRDAASHRYPATVRAGRERHDRNDRITRSSR